MSFYEISQPVFETYIIDIAPVKKIAEGFDWVEGPVWFGDANCLLFSDIPNNRIMRWTPDIGVSVYREPASFSNGQTRDRQGRLITCQHGTRSVTRTELDGTVTVLADSFEGKKLNSPNDVVVKSDDSVWFTDPHYGIMTNYGGYKADQELPCNVYRVEPNTGTIEAVITDMNCPNGIAFSRKEDLLYVADTGRISGDDPQHIRVYETAGNKVNNGRVFHTINPGCADGFRLDTDDNLWSSAADGVHCLSPDGVLLGKILVPELVSNICFGGRENHQLFITATSSVYMVSLNRSGCSFV